MKLVTEYTPLFYKLLNMVSEVSEEESINKVISNSVNLEKLINARTNEDISVYIEIPRIAIGAIKYRSTPIYVREKKEEGLYLKKIEPYLELSDGAVSEEFRGQKLSKEIYNQRLEFLEYNHLYKLSNNLLIGGVGILREFYDKLYAEGEYNKNSQFIPREIFGPRWEDLEQVRAETKATEVYANRLGLLIVGSSKTHGGPIYLSTNSKDTVRMRI